MRRYFLPVAYIAHRENLMLKRLIVPVVIALASASAFADLSTPTGGSGSSSYTTVNGNFATDLTSIDGNLIATPAVAVPTGGTVTFNLTIPTLWYQESGNVQIVAGTVPYNSPGIIVTFKVDSATYIDADGTELGTGVFGAGIHVLQYNGALTIGAAAFVVAGAAGTTPGFDTNNVTGLRIVFIEPSATGSGNDGLQINRISNPEPGTIALFGLGALGLGGFAMRRRKARKAAAAKA